MVSSSVSTKLIRLGTRGSSLALAQANQVAKELSAANPKASVEVQIIRTSGDHGNREVLGAFVKEIQEALLDDQIDIALHCLKDLPTTQIPGLTLAAMLDREDPREAWIGKTESIHELKPGSIVGTGSLRRTSQLRSIRSDLEYRPLMGNVDTRLRKVLNHEYDAILLAIAGLKRMNWLDNWEETSYSSLKVTPISVEDIIPAAGQAVLALEAREEDEESIRVAAKLNCQSTRDCATAERSFLGYFGSGCSVPIGAYAHIKKSILNLTGVICSEDGKNRWQESISGKERDAFELGLELAKLAPNSSD